MKRTRLTFVLTVLMAATGLAQTGTTATAPGDSLNEQHLPWPLGMQARLDSMMRTPLTETTQLGLMVWDLTDDRWLSGCNHRQTMRPASTMKLLTAITALDLLGSEHEFSTSLHHDGTVEGHTLMGNLYAVGSMDPLFATDDLRSFAESVKRLGIDTIRGTLALDVSMKDTLRWGEGWCWDDNNPTLSPLLVARKADFGQQLLTMLADCGVTVSDVVTATAQLPDAGTTLVCERRHRLTTVMQRMMKDSDNLSAEAVFYQVAAQGRQQPARAADAVRKEKVTMERAGLNSARYRLADGSGLSLYNYLSAEAEVRLLRYAYMHRDVFGHLWEALPIAGEDGTLKRRMKDTAAQGRVRAKTGTLTGVITLAGYATASNGHLLAFAMMNQGVLHAADARDFQDKVCAILCE